MKDTFDIVALGRAGVDLYSLDYGAPFSDVKKFAKYVGGTSANVMVGASRLGLRCALITRVSRDVLGDYVIGYLKAEGVETKYIKQEEDGKTGIVFAEVTPGRDSFFIFYRENVADLHTDKRDVRKKVIEAARSVLVTGTGLSQEPSFGANLYAANLGEKLGKTVVFNLDWRPTLWREPVKERTSRYRRVLRQAGVVIGNESEYLAATGETRLKDAISAIPGNRDKTLVITRGEKGSTVIEKAKTIEVPGFRVPLMKGLGGGDGFISGFMFGYLRGWTAARAAMLGNAVGAIVVQGHACSESMPRPAQLASFLEERGLHFDLGYGASKG
ncbi:MAG: 5-dehydro-2-deoxygluconokinase [Thaumarchaeota archaeon]|nr:5-dehydro-2-deoxygluconokinase [Nitrososphaerota archaeon]